MHDIKAIRENPDAFDAAMARRGQGAQAKRILDQDLLIRKAKQVVQEAEAARNKSSKLIGAAMKAGDREEAERLKTEVQGAKNVIAAMGAQVDGEQDALRNTLLSLPNLPADDVPEGEDESDNVEIARWGDKPEMAFAPKAHDDLGEALGMMDFETAAKMSGSRFVVLRGQLAKLDRALAAMMLDMQTGEGGYEETNPPLLVWPRAMEGTGQLPKFAEDSYATEEHFLIPTAEVSLTNTVRESIVDLDSLPKRMTAHTPCFRSEAGSAGRDTKGMIRQHQFNKVELVSICTPEQAEEEHKHMLMCAEKVLQALGLHYRVMELCTGDLGFGAKKTYDLEVWLPSQDTFREISSISWCGDFQARRMNARYRAGEKDNRFVHTLNGSGLAVGRTLVALLENYQQEDGTIRVPDALVPYMGGLKTIG